MSLKTFFKVGEANAEVARLTNELTSLQASADQLRTEHGTALQTVQARVTELETNLSTVTGNLTAVTGERDSARAELATAKARVAELEAKQTTVDQKAAELAATVGTPAALQSEGTPANSKSKEQLWTEFNALKAQEEKRAFWTKHRAAMR